MSGRRVAVTGIGVFCAAGTSRDSFRESMLCGRSAVVPLTGFNGLHFHNAARITNYDPLAHFTAKELDLIDPFAQYALLAAREAIADAHIDWTAELREATGVITGSCTGGKLTEDDGFRGLYAENKPRVPPMVIPRTMANSGASMIGMRR